MSVLQDIRLAFRFSRRTPVPTGIALVSIALSVGATAVVFTAIKSVLIDPLPYARASELVQIRSEYSKMREQSHGDWVFWNDTQELVRRTRTLESVGVYRNAVFDLAGGSDTTPEALYGLKVTASLFPTLGVSPMPRTQHSSGGGSTRSSRRDDSQLRPVGAPVPLGSWCGRPDRNRQRSRLPRDRRDAARL